MKRLRPWRTAGFPIVLLLAVIADAQTPVRNFLQAEAERIDLLAPLELGNYGWVPKRDVFGRDRTFLESLAASSYSTSDLLPLLSDPSPRIRVLALELLFRKEDPRLLPVMYRLTSDTERTFDRVEYFNLRANGPPDKRRAAQTVADFAKAIAAFYGVSGEFDRFWAARKDRRYWFTLLQSRLARVTGGLPTLNPDVKPRLAPFRALLDGFPALDRNLYLIWLQCTFAEPALARDAEFSAAVRSLGRENVLAIAEGNPPGGDPDLQPARNPGFYRLVAAMTLDHSDGVLQRPDAARLAAVVQKERDRLKSNPIPETFIGPSYTIAQARLLPERASEILHAELRAHTGEYAGDVRGVLAAGLAQIRGDAELSFLREFFYSDPPVPGFGLLAQRTLVGRLKRGDQPLLEQILSDERAKSLSPGQMAHIYERFPALRRKLLLDWFFAQKQDPRQMGNSIEYFLTIMSLRNQDEALRQAILEDPRFPESPFRALVGSRGRR
ncbi:MAG: hypothetical protein HYX25_00180 [Candidatus Solibacter usitatus]|nr:hypothetical protein [Candidatus Solibacter usitatus]